MPQHNRAISIHVPRKRDDPWPFDQSYPGCNFNPRPSWEGRHDQVKQTDTKIYISIHVPRERNDARYVQPVLVQAISIHVPRERDDWALGVQSKNRRISIHVPRERDDFGLDSIPTATRFISIHVPRERDDLPVPQPTVYRHHFNPRPSWEGRQCRRRMIQPLRQISIHVPRERDDRK